MKLAHIVPHSLLECARDSEAFLCLSNLVVRNPFYAEFHRRMAREGKLVILDNPVHENGELDLREWAEAAKLITPTVAIIPDVIDDANATVMYAREFRGVIREWSPSTRLMAVPHGVEQIDFLRCAQELLRLKNPSIHWFGVSLERRLDDDPYAFQRRVQRVRMLTSEPSFRYRSIHLLGVSEAASEFLHPAFLNVASADTSKFAVWWLNGTAPLPPSPIKQPYPGRASLGGSTRYFDFEPQEAFLRDRLAEYLLAWTNYAIHR